MRFDVILSQFAVLFQGNAIYNILPDVISRLSDPDVGIAEDNFQEIMRYVMCARSVVLSDFR